MSVRVFLWVLGDIAGGQPCDTFESGVGKYALEVMRVGVGGVIDGSWMCLWFCLAFVIIAGWGLSGVVKSVGYICLSRHACKMD